MIKELKTQHSSTYLLKNISPCFRYNAIIFGLLTSWSMPVQGNDFAQFNASFLRGIAATQTNIERFNYGNPITEGTYLADVYLNNQLKARVNIIFTEVPNKNTTGLCATQELRAILDLTDNAFISDSRSTNCPLFSEIVPEATTHFDISTLRLDVKIPQAYIKQRPRGYISPVQWETGVPVAFLRYDASHYQYSYASQHTQQTYLGLDAGINFAGWALRHRGNQTWIDQKRTAYNNINTYIQRDIATLRGQLTIGEFTTSGNLMESISLRGVQLMSDDRMLASSVRGYAPIIRGVAHTNALITIRQKNNVLRELTVPAGPFVIDDLYPIGYGGDLQVDILEANGEKRSFTVPYIATAQLMRPGYSRYEISVGRYRYDNKLFDEKVLQATWQYGLSNNLTLNLGSTLANKYHAELIGFAWNTPIGAFATNASFSSARFNQTIFQPAQKRRGYNLYASYNTRLDPTDTNITLAAYRYLSRGYYSLQEVIRINNNDYFNPNHWLALDYTYRPKNQFQLTISQNFKNGWGYGYITGTTSTFWENRQKQREFQIGYSNHYKKVNYGITLSQSRTADIKDTRFYFTLSFMFGSNKHYIAQNLSHSKLTGYSSTTSLSGSLGKDNLYTYNLSYTKQDNNFYSMSLNNQYHSPFVRVGGSWSRDNQYNQQFSLDLSGAIVAHPKGVTLANNLGDTFAIIHAKGAKGAKINNTTNSTIDYFGNGILPYIDPYNINYVGINTENLPDHVELSATEQQVIPRANNAILVNFATTVGQVVFLEITNEDILPPIGTEVFDKTGENVGIVAQGGRIYTRGISAQGQLNLHWMDQHCIIDYQFTPSTKLGDLPIIIPVQCKMKEKPLDSASLDK